MSRMSNRERLIATLKCEATDGIPISPLAINQYEWPNTFPAYRPVIDAVRKYGTPFVKVPLNKAIAFCDPVQSQISTTKKEAGETLTITRVLKTPKGELTEISQRDKSVGGAPAKMKSFVESDEDADKYISMNTYDTFLPDVTNILEKQKEVGDNGLVCVNGISSPFLMAARLFKYEFFLMWAYMNPDKMKAICEVNYKRLEKLLDYLIDKNAGPVFRWYNIEGYTTPMLPPSFADEFIVPYDKPLIQKIHDAGFFVDNHCHGQLKDQVHNFLDMKVDCINCVEPPPANDIDLKTLKQATQNQIAFWGYVQWEDMERKSEQEIRTLTREALEMSGNRGFILSQAASAYAGEISQHFSDNLLAMIDEGVKYNQDVFG